MEEQKIFPWLKDIHKNMINEYQVEEVERYSVHEIDTLREEIKAIHQTYKKEINKLEIGYENLRKLNIENIQKLIENRVDMENLNEDNKLLILKCSLLINSREEWIGRTLKLQFLFKEIEKIGLKQSDLIFESYKDVDIPDSEVPLSLKERFIPTILTNSVEDIYDEDPNEDPNEDAF